MANYVYAALTLTGGASTALDNIDGANLADGDLAIVGSSAYFYFYRLNATSAKSESSPRVITPDSNAGNKRWELVSRIGSANIDFTTTTTTSSTTTTTTTAA